MIVRASESFETNWTPEKLSEWVNNDYLWPRGINGRASVFRRLMDNKTRVQYEILPGHVGAHIIVTLVVELLGRDRYRVTPEAHGGHSESGNWEEAARQEFRQLVEALRLEAAGIKIMGDREKARIAALAKQYDVHGSTIERWERLEQYQALSLSQQQMAELEDISLTSVKRNLKKMESRNFKATSRNS